MTQILTHRGLHPAHNNFFPESSIGAFDYFLDQKLGLEFDVQITRDGVPFVFHDPSLRRVGDGSNSNLFNEVTAHDIDELQSMQPETNAIVRLDTLLEHVSARAPLATHALHIKHNCHSEHDLEIIAHYISAFSLRNLFTFDLTPEAATTLKKYVAVDCGISIAHPFDRTRYNTVVGGTLFDISDLEHTHNLFSWGILDEWDTKNTNGGTKKLYTPETFEMLRMYNMKITVISPELHATSPGLLGAEKHEDAESIDRLTRRMSEIIDLHPDTLCTDYPDIALTYLTP